MTVEDAIAIRDRAIALGLEDCCEECREAIERLRKLGQTSDFSMTPKVKNPTYPQGKRIATVGLGQEDAVRYLRRQIGAAA